MTKEDISLTNTFTAIALLVISIISILSIIVMNLGMFLISELSYLKQAFNQGDYIFFLFAWTMLHGYTIILMIEWLRGKSIKEDIVGTLSLIVAVGIWGVIRGGSSMATGIAAIIFYGIMLIFFYKTKKEKLFT